MNKHHTHTQAAEAQQIKGLTLIPGESRGKTDIGWLESWHSFSFGRYYEPDRMSFRSLRVINDDFIAPGAGFGEHGHNDMEIITWVIDGSLRHRDSLGHEQAMVPGELQLMRAGRGIRHSEFNDSSDAQLHLFQIWIDPAEKGLKPDYWQKVFDAEGRKNQWQRLVSKDGAASNEGQAPFLIAQDAHLDVAELDKGKHLPLELSQNRYGYVQITKGAIQLETEAQSIHLKGGDAFSLDEHLTLKLIGLEEENQLLFFDLA